MEKISNYVTYHFFKDISSRYPYAITTKSFQHANTIMLEINQLMILNFKLHKSVYNLKNDFEEYVYQIPEMTFDELNE